MDNAVRLRWTSHQGTVLSVFDALLASESLVDVTLAADGQYIRAHKIILSACSPYFQDLLSLDNNKSPIIFLKDVKFFELKALVQFIYRGEVNIGQDQLLSFLAVAQSLKIRGLASVDVSNNGVGSDTLIIPEFNNSLNTNESANPNAPAPAPVIAGRTGGNEYKNQTNQQQVSHSQVFQRTPRTQVTNSIHQTVQVHVDQAQNSIPPNSDLRNRTVLPPTLPPPSKRLRSIQQDPLDLEALTVSITDHSQSQHMYDPLSEKPSTSNSGDGRVRNQSQCGMQDEMNAHGQGEHMFHAEDVDVKLGIDMGEGMETNVSVGLGLYDESENGDASLSQSDFKDDELHPFQNVATVMMDGSTEEIPMPGGSGTSRNNRRRTAISSARTGTATVDEVAGGHTAHTGYGSGSEFKCHTCGKTYSSKGSLTRHRRYECTINIRPFACSWCDYRTSFKHNLKRHQEVCARKPSS